MTRPAVEPIAPTSVRYIKLGRGGEWEKECIDGGIVRFGTGTERPTRFEAAIAHRWAEVTQQLLDDGRDPGSATRFTNETRHFFANDAAKLWITFYQQTLWWAFLDPSRPTVSADGRGTFRRVVDAWRSIDIAGNRLTTDRLSGSLTKSASYRGTSFALETDAAEYVIRRINGTVSPQVDRALAATEEMLGSARDLVGLLGPRDFELLVDLVFSGSGWRRMGAVGGTQKTLDLDVQLPSTGERALIQVKSSTNDAELAHYIASLDDLGPYQRMFFVYHHGNVRDPQDERVVLIGAEKLAELVVDAGLVGWLIGKVR